MFTNFTLISEIARQRQSDALARSARHHRLFRKSLTTASRPPCPVIDMPTTRGHHAAGSALVA